MIRRTRNPFRRTTFALCAALLVTSTAPASASTETLKRSVSNLSQAPLDVVFSPMVGLLAVIMRMREHDDPVGVRVAFAGPGVVWNTGVNVGSSAIRFVTGAIELIPGILLVPFEADLDSLYSPVANGAALFEMETSCCIDVKFGIDYTAAVN